MLLRAVFNGARQKLSFYEQLLFADRWNEIVQQSYRNRTS